jgi:protein TonB
MNATMSENKQTTDSELLLQIVGYNSVAFEQLYNRYSATVYSLIKEIVTNPKLAEKILLNVFSVFLKRIDYYSANSNDIFTWLTLLARNISIDALKRMKFVEDIPIYSDDYEIEFILPNLSQVISPISLDERDSLGEKIKSYKSHLSEVQNLVLSLVYFEGLNEEEIAKRLSVPFVMVRQKILGIMESLHRQYTGQTEDPKSNKEVLNLIKLEALGCLSSEERTLFIEIRKNDPDFFWKELGEYQNLTALLATSISLENPPHELNGEIKEVFTKILQGSEVDYPIIAPEPPVIKQYQEPIQEAIQETVQEQIQHPIPEVIKQSEVQVKKKPEFELKFRERDPKELSLLKKLETVETKPKPVPVAAKIESEIQFRSYKSPDKKLADLVEKKDSSIEIREVLNAVIKEDTQVQNKVSTIVTEKPDLQIENDDPSIIIEEPTPIAVKEETPVKNRLIPNSSINLKEIFKKEDRTIVSKENNPVIPKEEKQVIPVVEKPEIRFKTNEPPKEFRRNNLFVEKDENKIQNKLDSPIPLKSLIENKTVPIAEVAKVNTVVAKEEKKSEEKPVTPPVVKHDIIIKTNEPPKEIRSNNSIVDKAEKILESKQPLPVADKTRLENKTPEPVKEIKLANTVIVKEEKKVEEKPVAPVVVKPDIIIKTNEPPKEVRRSNIFIDNDQKATVIIPVIQKAKNPESDKKPLEPVSEVHKPNVVTAKDVKPVEIKAPQVIKQSNIKTEVQESISPKEKINPEIIKEEKSFERIKPAVDRSNLKIRETVFAENERKPETIKHEVSEISLSPKPENQKVDAASNLVEAINIDEIISKIDNDKPEPAQLTESESYEKEIVKLRKKLRRNILVSAAMFIIIIASSIFVFLKFQEAPVKVSARVSSSEKLNLAGQTNFILNSEYKPEVDTKNIVAANETTLPEQSLKNQKILTPRLQESITKEESTLFASNINTDLISNEEKEPTQIAAAKTETVVPPKEIKKVEEEPAFFVAVEEMPQLIGGLKGIQGQIKYPEIAKRVGVEGKVIVQAIVDETGNVISVSTVKGIGSGCDEVAMDAVRNSKFTPGKQRGKNVKVQITIPIVFKK